MQMNIQSETVVVSHAKLLGDDTRPPMRRLYAYVEPEMYEEILQVSQNENLEISAALRQLLSIALRYYKHKRGTLNPDAPGSSKTFHCQSCKRETKMRYVIYKQIDFDQYSICEECAFDPIRLERFTNLILRGIMGAR